MISLMYSPVHTIHNAVLAAANADALITTEVLGGFLLNSFIRQDASSINTGFSSISFAAKGILESGLIIVCTIQYILLKHYVLFAFKHIVVGKLEGSSPSSKRNSISRLFLRRLLQARLSAIPKSHVLNELFPANLGSPAAAAEKRPS